MDFNSWFDHDYKSLGAFQISRAGSLDIFQAYPGGIENLSLGNWRMMRKTISILLLTIHCTIASAQVVTPAVLTSDGGPDLTNANGLAKTPPMGWSSWNQFGDDINEQLIMETIDALESTGLRDAGFRFVNLDDGWQAHKGSRSNHPLEYDSKKFPSGIKAVADYAHSKGFKMGIYSGPGEKTCAGYTGSKDHEQEDARMFATWGIDHLKYDACCSHQNASIPEVQKVFRTMSEALLNTSQPTVYHTCHCGWADI